MPLKKLETLNKITGYLIFLLLLSNPLLAQDESLLEKTDSMNMEVNNGPIPLEKYYADKLPVSPLRKFLSVFHLGVYIGTGYTQPSHTLTGFGIAQTKNYNPLIYTEQGNNIKVYSSWVSDVTQLDSVPNFLYTLPAENASISFKSKAFNIPIGLSLHINVKYVRIGGGISLETMSMGKFVPSNYSDKISTFKNKPSKFSMTKYYGSIGVPFLIFPKTLFMMDAQVGIFKLSSKQSSVKIKSSMYFNVGLTVERSLSEYLKAFVRPSYERKQYALPIDNINITHKLNAAYITVGVTYSLPILPKCFLSKCKAQVDHSHGNKSYRSRVHPIYKKQHPGYGENYKK